MVDQNLEITEKLGSSAAATPPTYSAQELADIYMKCRADFLEMDMELATCGWNNNYVFDFFYYIGDEEQIALSADWIVTAWKEKHHMLDTYESTKDVELEKQATEFACRVLDIQKMAMHKIKEEKRKNALKEKMLSGKKTDSFSKTETTSQPVVIKTETHIPPTGEANETVPPRFGKQSMTTEEEIASYQVLLTDLPEEISKKIIVSQEVFDVYVYQLNTDTWSIVEKKKGTYCDALRFLSNFYYITSRNTTREQFDTLLHHVIKGEEDTKSFVSSMGRRQDTTEQKLSRCYLCYASKDVNSKMKDEIWQLVKDCQQLEDSFQPVLAKMEAERQKQEKQA